MKYIFFAGFLFCIFFSSVCFSSSSSGVGKRPSGFKSLNLAQVAGKLLMMQINEQDKIDLYRALRSADREKGARNTIQYLLKVVKVQTANLPENFEEIDWFGLAIESIFLGSLQRFLMHKELKETDYLEQLASEIEEMKDVVFNTLQDQALSASPRGAEAELTHSGKKKKSVLFFNTLISDLDLQWLRKNLDVQLLDYIDQS